MKRKLSDVCEIEEGAFGECFECLRNDWDTMLFEVRLLPKNPDAEGTEEILIHCIWCELTVTLCKRCLRKKKVVLSHLRELIAWRRTSVLRQGKRIRIPPA